MLKVPEFPFSFLFFVLDPIVGFEFAAERRKRREDFGGFIGLNLDIGIKVFREKSLHLEQGSFLKQISYIEGLSFLIGEVSGLEFKHKVKLDHKAFVFTSFAFEGLRLLKFNS